MKKFAEILSSVQAVVIAFLVLAASAAFVAITIREVFTEIAVIEEFGLPNALSDLGYSGKVAARRLLSEIDAIEDEVSSQDSRLALMTDGQQLEIAAPGGGLSLRSFTDIIRVLLQRPQTRIEGEFICPDEKCVQAGVELRLRVISGGDMKRASAGEIGELASGQSNEERLDEYFHRSAIELLSVLDPLISASYLSERNPERARLTAQAVYNSAGEDRGDAAQMIGLIDLNAGRALDAAEWFEISIQEYTSRKNEARLRDNLNCWAAGFCAYQPDDSIAVSYYYLNHAYASAHRFSAAAFASELSLRHLQAAAIAKPEDADLCNTWGWVLMVSGQPRAAIKKFEQAIRMAPEFAAPYVGWGENLVALKKIDEAIEKYRQALTINPAYTYAGVRWAYALRDRGELSKSRDKLAEMAGKAPGRALMLADWGYFLLPGSTAVELLEEDVVRDKSEVADKFREALKIGPAHPDWIIALLEQLPESEAAIKVDEYLALADTRPAKAMIRHYWGSRLLHDGKNADAMRQMRLAVQLMPDDPKYLVELADFLWNSGEKQQAIAHYRKAAQEQEREAWVFARLADRLEETGEHDEARATYEHAASIATEMADSATLFEVARGYDILDRPDKALIMYEAAARLSPEDYWRQVSWADSLEALGRPDDAAGVRKAAEHLASDRAIGDNMWWAGDQLGALHRYELASRENPEDLDLRLLWAQRLWSSAQYDEALERYRELAESDPDNPARFREWADRLAERRSYESAASRYVDAAKLGDPAALAPAGLYFALDGQYDEASSQFDEALRKNPKDDVALTYWGRSLALQGLDQKAIEKYREATIINPANSYAFGRWGTSLWTLDPMDKDGKAVAKYRQALEIDPSNRHALGAWGRLLAGNNDHAGAIDKFRTLAEIDGNNPVVYLSWAASIAAIATTDGGPDCAKLRERLRPYQASAERAGPEAEAKDAIDRAMSGDLAACQITL